MMAKPVSIDVESYTVTGIFDLLGPAATPLQRVEVSPFEITKLTADPGKYRFEMRLNDGRQVRGEFEVAEGARIFADTLISESTSKDTYVEYARAEARKVAAFNLDSFESAVGEEGARIFALREDEAVAASNDRKDDGPVQSQDVHFDFHDTWAEPGASFSVTRFLNPDNPAPTAVAVEIQSTLNDKPLPPFTLILPRMSYVGIEVRAAGANRHSETRARANGQAQILLDLLANPAPVDPSLLYRHLASGLEDQDGAKNQVEELARKFVKDKFDAPEHAAMAGWYLMRISKMEVVRDWPRNLADYFTDLPDGAVIEGWRRLEADVKNDDDSNPPYPTWRRNSPPPATRFNPNPNDRRPDNALADAALRFTAAAFRGPPRFAMGVRRLAEGLDWCSIALQRDNWPAEMAAARARAKRWSNRLRPNTALTVFEGTVDDLDLDATFVSQRPLRP